MGEITLSPHSVKQICVVKQPVGDVKKQLGQDVASISKWYLEAYQRINDVIVKNQILGASFIGYLGDNISIPKICRRYFFQNLYQGRFFCPSLIQSENLSGVCIMSKLPSNLCLIS